jgi:hypothetical protein
MSGAHGRADIRDCAGDAAPEMIATAADWAGDRDRPSFRFAEGL